MIQVSQVTKRYESNIAVSDISFTVQQRETLVILGSSGSGKTTTLKMLNRLVEPDTGEIIINGRNILHQPLEELRRNMGYVIQQTGLFPHYTVEENIGLIPRLLKWPGEKIKERTRHLLETLGLPTTEFATRYPHELSGGQQQRIGLARALAANPAILLMDEPFGALDPVIRHTIRQEFLNLEELKDKTTILVTHDVTEAVLLASQICLMHQGVIQQMGSAKELLLQPANSFVKDFFDQNRFQLERMVFSLSDIWPYLQFVESDGRNVLIFDSKESIWQVLNHLQPSETELVGIRHQSKVYYVSIRHIMDFMPGRAGRQ